ncbi:epoxyqueuosine reductase [Bdellovibrio bacteriovorus]|uniref:Epoxyqueuosine reductase n=1 Tax=Bdellovibrio bacteriovorus TaxID=959 RepID=A0A150WKD0_BDEBC|nr:tRNA epoxyqueuosine(34) reductase QueG [Bdellovibrio bacteriovorus]KYG64083.1 epoxyqueuosine reductase [Bdellovibrio bacteriovorus]
MTLQEIQSLIDQHLQTEGFSHFGVAALERPFSMSFYNEWLKEGLHGDMKYLAEHAGIKENPQSKWPRAHSALVFAIPYFPHPQPQEASPPLSSARISLYAQGMDYHFWFKDKMNRLCSALKEIFPDEEFLAFTDSSPILERDLARRAGLGWVGKNTCVIHPKKGSLFFIGEIYTSLNLKTEIEPLPDFCGKCQKCIDICPTGALLEPRKMDARKCISYLTIESREVPEESLRSQIGDWFFGCDLCQTTCPWNEKVFKGQLNTETVLSLSEDQEADLKEDLRYILTASGKQLSRDFLGTPLARAGSFGLKRNALIVIANRKISALQEEVRTLQAHPKLGELATWTLEQLKA